jgi:lipopolysaccharide transport system permease protein
MSPTPIEECVYSADAKRRKGILIWMTMFRDLWAARDLIARLVHRDITVRYRQSILGYVWAILPPIVTVALFTFLTERRVFPMGQTPLPYTVFALWNLSVWQLFSSCLVGSTNSLVQAGALVTKINFPKEALVIAPLGQALFDFLLRLIPVAAVFAWYQVTPSWQAIAMPLILVPVILMALGLGFLFSIANLVMRDIGNALSMVLTFATFLAPILYPPPVREPFYLINLLNPFSPLLIATQDLLAEGRLSHPDTFFFSTIFSLLIFLGGWRVFHITMPRIAERA